MFFVFSPSGFEVWKSNKSCENFSGCKFVQTNEFEIIDYHYALEPDDDTLMAVPLQTHHHSHPVVMEMIFLPETVEIRQQFVGSSLNLKTKHVSFKAIQN